MSNINICAQNAYLALYPQSKKPVGVNWPDEGKSQEDALAANGNLGLLLGPKSDVMDVDLDCRDTKRLAELILPEPFAQFDRRTSDSGHYLFRATSLGPTQRLSSSGPKSNLVEPKGNGSQTLIPPSMHSDGYRLDFTDFDLPVARVCGTKSDRCC